MTDPRRTRQPHDRLTRLADVMTRALEADGEYHDGDKAIVFLDDGSRGGIVLHGYDRDTDAVADLLVHLQAIMRAKGKDLMVTTLGQG